MVEVNLVLKNRSKHELIKIIKDLYSLSSSNKNFIEARFSVSQDLILRYKELIQRSIAPHNVFDKISLRKAKAVITEYKKATSDIIGTVDLMVSYVEYGTKFTLKYGDMYEAYYCSLESVFLRTLKYMKKIDTEHESYFVNKLRKIVISAEEIGWGYYDCISEAMNEYLSKV